MRDSRPIPLRQKSRRMCVTTTTHDELKSSQWLCLSVHTAKQNLMEDNLQLHTVTEDCLASSFSTLAWSVSIILFVSAMST